MLFLSRVDFAERGGDKEKERRQFFTNHKINNRTEMFSRSRAGTIGKDKDEDSKVLAEKGMVMLNASLAGKRSDICYNIPFPTISY